MDLKHRLSQLISLALIGIGLYQVLYTASLILFVYPQIEISHDINGLLLQEGLIEKAIVYYFSMLINGFYGFFLLFKPKEEIHLFYLAAGVAIGIFSYFFITRTPLTINPIDQVLDKL